MGQSGDWKAEVVVWRGTHQNDGLERLKWIKSALHVFDAKLRGEAGDWEIVVEARLA